MSPTDTQGNSVDLQQEAQIVLKDLREAASKIAEIWSKFEQESTMDYMSSGFDLQCTKFAVCKKRLLEGELSATLTDSEREEINRLAVQLVGLMSIADRALSVVSDALDIMSKDTRVRIRLVQTEEGGYVLEIDNPEFGRVLTGGDRTQHDDRPQSIRIPLLEGPAIRVTDVMKDFGRTDTSGNLTVKR